jgi:beta-glucosidase
MSDASGSGAAADIDKRVADLLGRMTPQEKLAQLGSVWSHELLQNDAYEAAKVQSRLAEGIGQITRIAGATNLGQREAAELANRLQKFLVERTRLGIPAMVHEECLHGLLARESVCFPQSINHAAAWNPDLTEAMADRLGRELRAAGAHQALAPIFDITRDPRWGRIEETYGEDPYLAAVLGCAYTRGLQGATAGGNGLADHVVATAKHMVGHGLPEGGLNHAPSHIGPRELRDFFLFPFEAAVRDADLRSVMHAYDDVDGMPCVASKALFSDTLRDEWGFDGIVVSDYAGIDELIGSHAVTGDRPTAAAMALSAGVDVELPATSFYADPLEQALADGQIDLSTIDRAVARVLRMKFELGLFENPYVNPEEASLPFEQDRALAREIARQSIVLLANDGHLPLRRGPARIAVIGPNADSARNLLGDYAHLPHIEAILDTNGFGLGEGAPAGLEAQDEMAGKLTILQAIRKLAGDANVVYARGCGLLDGTDDEIAEAVQAARGADVAVVVVGERSGLTDDCTCGEARDRADIGLPGRQSELVKAIAATGTPLVLVLVAGRPLAIPEEADLSAAVVHAWVPGEEGAEAVAEILFGEANPGGKLPVTVPRSTGQIPIYYGHKPSGGRSHWKVRYVDESNLPLWPFGYGLSYTTFSVSGLTLDRTRAGMEDSITATVEVTNTGTRAGDEVVQLYVRDLEASVSRPVKELRGFKRLALRPGERRRVSFELAMEQLVFTGVDGDLVLEPGRVRVMVGSSSEDLPCQAEFVVEGDARKVRHRTHYFTPVAVE